MIRIKIAYFGAKISNESIKIETLETCMDSIFNTINVYRDNYNSEKIQYTINEITPFYSFEEFEEKVNNLEKLKSEKISKILIKCMPYLKFEDNKQSVAEKYIDCVKFYLSLIKDYLPGSKALIINPKNSPFFNIKAITEIFSVADRKECPMIIVTDNKCIENMITAGDLGQAFDYLNKFFYEKNYPAKE